MYGDESRQLYGHYALATADDLTGAADDRIWDISAPVEVVRLTATITTAVVSTGDVVVKFDRRVTAGSDVGRGDGDVGIIKIPGGTAAGKVVYKDVANVRLDVGDQIVAEITTAAAGGGAAGAALYGVQVRARHETMANQGDAVASA